MLALCACSDKRKPIGRGDGGPSVVVLDGRQPDLAMGPSMPEHEPNDTVAQAEVLTGAVKGTLPVPAGKADVDVYRIDAPQLPDVDASATIPVAIVTLHAGVAPLVLDVLDAKGKAIQTREVEATKTTRVSSLRLDTPGLVRVRRGKAELDADYTIDASTHIAAIGEELEPNDDWKRANPLADDGNATGTLDPGDRDSLALPSRPAGTTWRIELAAQAELAPELRMRRGDQVLFTTRAGKGGELRLRNAPAGEGLIVQVRAVDGTSDQPYVLRFTNEAALDVAVDVEPNDDRVHATMVKPGDVAGYLWPGDVDWFCSDTHGIGAHVDALPDVDFRLELTDDAGKTLAKADEGKRGSAETLAPDPRATCVKVSAHSKDTAFDAPYHLLIKEP